MAKADRSRVINVALNALLVLYPLLVYFGLQQFGPRSVALILLLTVLLRFANARGQGLPTKEAQYLLLAAGIATTATLLSGSVLGLKFYPALVNATLLTIFATSLWQPPTVVERIARLQQPDLPAEGVSYTRAVTWVWCAFFTLNGSIALATAFLSDQIWAIYNGLISYCLIGTVFAIEYIVRMRRLP